MNRNVGPRVDYCARMRKRSSLLSFCRHHHSERIGTVFIISSSGEWIDMKSHITTRLSPYQMCVFLNVRFHICHGRDDQVDICRNFSDLHPTISVWRATVRKLLMGICVNPLNLIKFYAYLVWQNWKSYRNHLSISMHIAGCNKVYILNIIQNLVYVSLSFDEPDWCLRLFLNEIT
jgi:hypothetical protein